MEVGKVSEVAQQGWEWLVSQVKSKPVVSVSAGVLLGTAMVLRMIRWRRRKAMITDGMSDEDRSRLAVLITGSASGFGRALTLRLHDMGLTVIATDVSPMDSLKGLTGHIELYQMDITDYDQINQVASELKQKSIQLWAIVNNAGLANTGPFEARTQQGLKKECDVLFHGHLDVTRAFLPLILGRHTTDGNKEETIKRRNEICSNMKTNGGRVVNISSGAARMPFPFAGCYPSMKAALRWWAHSLRFEVSSRFGIWSSCIMPGAYNTPIFDGPIQRMQGIIDAAKTDLVDKNIPDIYGLDKYPEIMKSGKGRIKAMANDDLTDIVDTMVHSVLAVNPQYEYKVGSGWFGYLRYLPWPFLDSFLQSMGKRYP